MATDSPPTKPVTLLDSDLSEMSKNETLKVESEGLFWVAGKTKYSFRSEIEDLTEGRPAILSNEAKEISKHFGIYKQQERPERPARLHRCAVSSSRWECVPTASPSTSVSEGERRCQPGLPRAAVMSRTGPLCRLRASRERG